MKDPWLHKVCVALGWQGGTIHQVTAEIERLRAGEKFRQPALQQQPNGEANTAPHPALQGALFVYEAGPDGAAAVLIRGWAALDARLRDEVAGFEDGEALRDLDEWMNDGWGAPYRYSANFEDGHMVILRIHEDHAAATAQPWRITLRQAEHLVAFFGGHDAEVAVSREGAGQPPGLYAWCVDCPEEGSVYLGPTEVDDELADKGRPKAATAQALERGMQALMARLVALLDEDQFKDCEDIVRKAGVAAPVGGLHQAWAEGYAAANRDSRTFDAAHSHAVENGAMQYKAPPATLNPYPATGAAHAAEPAMSRAARDVLAERQRQITAEGWTPEHDDQHDAGDMAAAAACYALHADAGLILASQRTRPAHWPWDRKWWKPGPTRRMLEKAGALILAEMERLDRRANAGTGHGETETP